MFWPFGGKEQLRRRFAHLPNAAGRGLELQREHRLDGVDDHEGRPETRDFFENSLEAGFRQDVERRTFDTEPLAARLDLVLGFLARAVEHRADGAGKVGSGLEQQRRLADARFPADEHERSRNDAAAEHPVELADASRQPFGNHRVDVRVELRPGRTRQRISLLGRTRRHRRGHGTLLDHRVPRTALRAPAQPLRGLGTALLTGENGFRLHRWRLAVRGWLLAVDGSRLAARLAAGQLAAFQLRACRDLGRC